MTATHTLDGLRARFAGTLVTPDDPAYPDARRVWNGAINRYPGVVARCTGPADVAHAIEYARDADSPLAVRGGGHGVAGGGVVDDGVVVDLSPMNGVRVDPDERVARVGGGALWRDVDRETQRYGLATPGGAISDTGVAGLTLGGGLGHLRRLHGLSCDNVRSMDVVTADGDLVVAAPTRNEDLFWALRGGGNFGAVTSFEFDLHPVGPDLPICFVWYPAAGGADLLRAFRDWAADAPREVSVLAFYAFVPATEEFPRDHWGDPAVVFAGASLGDSGDGATDLDSLRELGEPIVDFSATMPYVEVQQLLDADYPSGRHYYWKSVQLDAFTDAVADLVVEYGERSPSTLSTVDLWQLGGAVTEGGGAYPNRDAAYLLNFEANWDDPRETTANVEWVREGVDAARGLDAASGMYVNFPGYAEDDAALAYGDSYDRLRDVKARYDPDNVFGGHTSIVPADE